VGERRIVVTITYTSGTQILFQVMLDWRLMMARVWFTDSIFNPFSYMINTWTLLEHRLGQHKKAMLTISHLTCLKNPQAAILPPVREMLQIVYMPIGPFEIHRRIRASYGVMNSSRNPSVLMIEDLAREVVANIVDDVVEGVRVEEPEENKVNEELPVFQSE
jgi:hypothetical protein